MNHRKRNESWSDDELCASVDAYLYMLRLEVPSIPYSPTKYTKFLQTGPLRDRNDASIRYGMRNISQVMEERGAPILRSFSPAAQVGRNVKKKINELLNARLMPPAVPKERRVELSDILVRLDELKIS